MTPQRRIKLLRRLANTHYINYCYGNYSFRGEDDYGNSHGTIVVDDHGYRVKGSEPIVNPEADHQTDVNLERVAIHYIKDILKILYDEDYELRTSPEGERYIKIASNIS